MISILGDDPLTHEAATPYSDPGATATDNIDGDISENIATTNNVDPAIPGAYTVDYSVMDSSGNEATASRTVNVVDMTPPTVDLIGDNPLTHEAGTPFVDPGATAFDTVDGDLTESIVAMNSVDGNTPGIYAIDYAVFDAAGNGAGFVRIVNVVDTTDPIITILGQNPLTHEVGNTYTDAGATAFDTVDGDLTTSIVTTNNVNEDVVGTYTIDYTLTDTNGNTANASRTVNVVDSMPPSVTINQTAAQPDPTSDLPITFHIEFSEEVVGFDASGISFTGTADIQSGDYSVTMDSPTTYALSVDMVRSSGDVTPIVNAGAATDAGGNPNDASTSTDNTVEFNEPICQLEVTPISGDFGLVAVGETRTISFRLDNLGLATCEGAIALQSDPPVANLTLIDPQTATEGPALPFTLGPLGMKSFMVEYLASSTDPAFFTTAVHVTTPGADPSDIEIPLAGEAAESLGRLEGRILDSFGRPVTCAAVRVEDFTTIAEEDGRFERVVTTDNLGFYSLEDIPADPSRAMAVTVYSSEGVVDVAGIMSPESEFLVAELTDSCGPVDRSPPIAALLVLENEGVHTLNFQLLPEPEGFFVVQGTVLGMVSGAPLGGVLVELFTGPGERIACAYTCSDGRYEMYVSPAKVPLRLEVDGLVAGDLDTDNFDLDEPVDLGPFQLPEQMPFGSLSGFVFNVDTSEAVTGAQVVAQFVDSGATQSISRVDITVTLPPDSGRFTIDNLPTGQYQLRVTRSGYFSSDDPRQGTEPPPVLLVTVHADQTTEVDIALQADDRLPPTAVPESPDGAIVPARQDGFADLTLNATASFAEIDSGRTVNQYFWSGTGGSPNPENIPTPTLEDLAPGPYTFSLVVIDSDGLFSEPVTIEILISGGLPIAMARVVGELIIELDIGETERLVTLDGSGSTAAEGLTITSYGWAVQTPDEGTPEPGDGPMPNVLLPRGTHTFSLVVTDELGQTSLASEVTIRVLSPDMPEAPQAVAGDDQMVTARLSDGRADVTLDGSESAAFGGSELASYVWTASSPGSPDPDDVAMPTLTLSLGVHEFQLFVIDDASPPRESAPDEVRIRVDAPEVPEPAIGGDIQISICPDDTATVQLSVAGDAAAGPVAAYRWRGIDSAPNPDDDAAPRVTGLVPGTYVFEATVEYASGLISSSARVTVTITGDALGCTDPPPTGCSAIYTGNEPVATEVGDFLLVLAAGLFLIVLNRSRNEGRVSER